MSENQTPRRAVADCRGIGLRERLARRATSLRVDIMHAAVTDHCGTAILALSPQTVGSRLGTPGRTKAR